MSSGACPRNARRSSGSTPARRIAGAAVFRRLSSTKRRSPPTIRRIRKFRRLLAAVETSPYLFGVRCGNSRPDVLVSTRSRSCNPGTQSTRNGILRFDSAVFSGASPSPMLPSDFLRNAALWSTMSIVQYRPCHCSCAACAAQSSSSLAPVRACNAMITRSSGGKLRSLNIAGSTTRNCDSSNGSRWFFVFRMDFVFGLELRSALLVSSEMGKSARIVATSPMRFATVESEFFRSRRMETSSKTWLGCMYSRQIPPIEAPIRLQSRSTISCVFLSLLWLRFRHAENASTAIDPQIETRGRTSELHGVTSRMVVSPESTFIQSSSVFDSSDRSLCRSAFWMSSSGKVNRQLNAR